MHLRASALLSAALLAALGAPSRAQTRGPLRPLSLGSHSLHHGDRLVVRGGDCRLGAFDNGYESGYDIGLGDFDAPDARPYFRYQFEDMPRTTADGAWRASHVLREEPAGRYAVVADCFEPSPPRDYPYAYVTVVPGDGVRIDGHATIPDTTVEPGQSLGVTEKGFGGRAVGVFLGGTRYLASLYATPPGTVGTYTGRVTIPPGLGPGTYRLLFQGFDLKGNGGFLTLEADVTIPAPSPSPTTESPTPPPSPTPSATPTESPRPTESPTPSESPTTSFVEVASRPDDGSPLLVIGAGVGGAGVLAAGGAWVVVRRRRARPEPPA